MPSGDVTVPSPVSRLNSRTSPLDTSTVHVPAASSTTPSGGHGRAPWSPPGAPGPPGPPESPKSDELPFRRTPTLSTVAPSMTTVADSQPFFSSLRNSSIIRS